MEIYEIFETCLKNDDAFNDYDITELTEFGELIGENESICLKLFDIFQNQKQIFKKTNSIEVEGLTVEKTSTGFILKYEDSKLELKSNEYFKYLGYISDTMLPIYPLGTVFKVKNESFKDIAPMDNDAELYLVVTERFLTHSTANIYVPYGGVVYPFGAYILDQRIQFGPQLIEEVIYEGYTDLMEEEYIKLMKEEMLLVQGRHSMSFATDEEVERVQTSIAMDGDR